MFGKSKVEDLRHPARVYDHVGGFQVSVNDCTAMRFFKSIDDLKCEFQGWLDGNSGLRDHLMNRRAVDILHHDEGTSIILADFKDCADVRMLESRHRVCLAKESLPPFSVLENFFGGNFDCDGAPKAGVDRLVDDSHTTTRNQLADLVMRYGCAGAQAFHIEAAG